MIDILTRVSIFADYRTVSTLTQVCRLLNGTNLWASTININYPHMIDKCPHLPDYLRFLIAQCKNNLRFSYKWNGYIFEKTKQIMNSPLHLSNINPENLGRYYIATKYNIIGSGDKDYIINYFKDIHEDWHEKYIIYDSRHITYSFADIIIEIYDEDFDVSKFTYADFLIFRT